MQAMEAQIAEMEKRLAEVHEEVQEVGRQVPKDRLAIGLISGSLDRLLATFIISLGATAYDMEVDLFFSFWSIAALRDAKKKAKKNFLSKMFGWMLPTGSKKLPLSSMNMGGMGPKMIRGLMKKHGVPSLENMIQQAGELGVNIYVCEMSMDLMGFKREEMIDYPNLKYVGVGTFVSMVQDARVSFFL